MDFEGIFFFIQLYFLAYTYLPGAHKAKYKNLILNIVFVNLIFFYSNLPKRLLVLRCKMSIGKELRDTCNEEHSIVAMRTYLKCKTIIIARPPSA